MPRFSREGVVLHSTALRRCAAAVLWAAVIANARTLRHRGEAADQALATPLHEIPADPCAVWLQEHSGQKHSAVALHAQAPCPCLNTPPPLMTPEQTQAVEVQAAADNALLKGLTRIQEAAVEAAKPLEKQLEAMKIEDVEKKAQENLATAEKDQTAKLKLLLDAEAARQDKEMVTMEAVASQGAKASSAHLRETAEEWAANQAKNYIYLNSNGPMAEAIEKTQKTDAIRQEATELAKGAIKSAAQALEVAKKAQMAISMVPKDSLSKAEKAAAKSKEEQKKLNSHIESIEGSVRAIARVAQDGYDQAIRTLQEANMAEVTARKALETSRSNALKIEKLKVRAQEVGDEADNAKKAYKEAQQ